MDKKPVKPASYGTWHVTTEGDVEGRSTKDLGVHEGFLDEVALALAPAAYYTLEFQFMDTESFRRNVPGVEVNVRVIGSNVGELKKLLAGRPVTVEGSDYYNSAKIISGASPEERERKRREAHRQAALSKLTAAEIEALGLK